MRVYTAMGMFIMARATEIRGYMYYSRGREKIPIGCDARTAPVFFREARGIIGDIT